MNFKRTTAFLLVLCIVLPCIGTVNATDATDLSVLISQLPEISDPLGTEYYFYNQLTDIEKAFYWQITKATWDSPTIAVSCIDGYSFDELASMAQRALTALIADSPEYHMLWNRYCEAALSENGFSFTLVRMAISSEYRIDKAEARAQQLVEMVGTEGDRYSIVRDLLDLMSEEMNFGTIFAGNTTYVSGSSDCAIGCLVYGVAVCAGFSDTVKILCDKLQVPCIIVGNAGHAWNYIQMEDGLWYAVDASIDLPFSFFEQPANLIGFNSPQYTENSNYHLSELYLANMGDFVFPELSETEYVYSGTYQASYHEAEGFVEPEPRFVYSVNEDGTTCTITAYEGAQAGDLVIPDSIDGYAVTAIGDGAFYMCTGFTGDLIIADTVTTIGLGSFESCTGFTGTLQLPENLKKIGQRAFFSDYNFSGELLLPDGMETIGDFAFYGAGFEGELLLPDGLEWTNWAISGTKIESLAVHESNENYATVDGILYSKDLTTLIVCPTYKSGELAIPNGVEEIADGAFLYCSYLTGQLILPDSLKKIGSSAFGGCSGLSGDLIIPDSVTEIAGGAFTNCGGFNGSLKLPDGITRIEDFTFVNCPFTGNLYIPETVTYIGNNVFWGVKGSLSLPDSVEYIGTWAFAACTFSNTVDLSNSSVIIEKDAFYGSVFEKLVCNCDAEINCDRIGNMCDYELITNYQCSNCGGRYEEQQLGAGHTYDSVVTEPTCTEQGYTTHTCTVCGDSYVSDYTDKLNLTIIPITSAEIEQGGYYYGRDSQLTTRLRGADQIYVEAGTIVKYHANGLRVFFAIVSGPDADSYLEGGLWYTDSGEFQVTTDGYLSIIISQPDPNEEITVSDYTADIDIYMVSECAHDYEVVVAEPTYTAGGCTTHTCTKCGHSYITGYAEAKTYRILLIGNSFSHDSMRQFATVVQSMMGSGFNVEVHLAINAAKTVAWHATQADTDAASYKHRYYSTKTGEWTFEDDPLSTLDSIITSEQWDVVTLQSFPPEANTGTAKGLEGESEAFLSLENSVPYMLDYINIHAPGAKIYYFMIWAPTQDTTRLDAARGAYDQIVAMTQVLEGYSGTQTGKCFDGVIPVGTSIQNARSTYLALLDYTAPEDAEVVAGLQRDSVHMAYSIGGYITALTFAEYLFPEEVRAEGYVRAGVPQSTTLGALPAEYTAIAQAAVKAALESPYSVTALPGYETDPAEAAKTVIEQGTYDFTGIHGEEDLLTALAAVVDGCLTQDGFAAPVITLMDYRMTEDGTVTDLTATVELRFGYTTRTANIVMHTHTYTTVVTAPTCTERGYTTHTCACGDSYVDSYVDAKGHSYGEWTVVTEATCTENGQERRDCGNCDHYETRVIDAKGHNYTSVVTPPTCTEQGYTTYTCTCGHSYVDSYVEAKGHSYGDWTVVTDATCTENGQERRDCGNCDHYETRTIDAKGHDYTSVVTAPTCTEGGYTTHTCTECGDSYVGDYTDVVPHTPGEAVRENAVDATCTTNGSYDQVVCCADCGTELERETVETAPLPHAYDSVVTEPTCTEQGYTTYTCAACGDSYVDNYTEPLPHDFIAVVTEPTCTEGGYITHTCSGCGDSYVVPYYEYGTGHSMGDWYTFTEATCTAKGQERRDCANCDHYETRETDMIPHTFESVVTAPTYEADGYTTYTCTVCGHSYEDDFVPALVHHEVLDGEDAQWAPESEAPLTVRVDAEIENFVNVLLNGEVLDEECYTITEGSTIVTLKPEYLATLPAGEHMLELVFTDGGAEVTFEILAPAVTLGDVNGDEEIDILDANLVVAWYNEIRDLEDNQLLAADVNGDGEVDIMDANMIVAYYNELIDAFPANK